MASMKSHSDIENLIITLGWMKRKRNSSHEAKRNYLFSKVIIKITQALVPLFYWAVKTSFLEKVWLRLKPISNNVRDFAVRIKTWTIQRFFSGPNMWKSHGERSGLYGGCPTHSNEIAQACSVCEMSYVAEHCRGAK